MMNMRMVVGGIGIDLNNPLFTDYKKRLTLVTRVYNSDCLFQLVTTFPELL